MSDAEIRLLRGAYRGDLDEVRAALADGADVDFVPAHTGLGAIHLAVGRSRLKVLRYLVEEAGAAIKPDGFGRWPTVIAARCEASEEVGDYIVEREAEALGLQEEDSDHERDRDFD